MATSQLLIQKRGRTPAWSIHLEDKTPFERLIETCMAVQTKVNLQVVKMDGHHVLTVKAADVGEVCMVHGRLRVDNVAVEADDDDFDFTVDCRQIAAAIDKPSCAHYALTIEGHMESMPYILLRMWDPESSGHQVTSEFSLFEKVHDSGICLEDMTFDAVIELDMSMMREMIRLARKSHAEDLRISVYLTTAQGKPVSVTVFTVNGDFKQQQTYSAEVQTSEDGSRVFRASVDGNIGVPVADDASPVFNLKFPLEKIEAFIKNLPCRMIQANVAQDKPLLLTFPLSGDDVSSVRFLVCPCHEDSD